MKKLLIIDLEKNYEVFHENCFYLLTNRGSVNLKNSNKIDFNINKNKNNINKKKKNFISYLSKIQNIFKKNKFRIEASELEIFNLRNDKYNYIDKILLFSCLREKRLENKFKIEVITDQDNLKKFYQSSFGKKIQITNLLKKNKIKNKESSLILKYFKFILRALYFLIIIKILKKNANFKKNSDLCLSLYPYFFKNKNIDLYNVKEKTYLNFSLTDETHLNLSPIKYFNHIKKLSKLDKIVSIEKYIKFKELFFSMIKFYIDYSKLKKLFNKSFNFHGIDCTNLIYPHIKISFYNRSKLFLYERSLDYFLENNSPKKLNYFLFEYNFGFFLRNRLKKIKKFVGYQHGIYTNNLMWLDLVNSKKNDFLPNEIVCNRKESFKSYKKNFKKILLRKKINKLNKKLEINSKNSSNILVFLGQHDMEDCLYFFLNNKKFKDKKIYFKLHPNNKKKINILSSNFYFVDKVKQLKKYKVYLAPTTTLIYDFLDRKLKFEIIKFHYKIDLWN
jgi:hypothetical protein